MTGVSGNRVLRWLRSLLHTLTLRQAVLAVAAVVVVASGLFGGLATATPDGPKELTARKTVAAAPFDLTIERVRWLSDLGDDEPDPNRRYIGVVARITNTSDHPVYIGDARRTLRLLDADGIHPSSRSDETAPSIEVDPTVTVLADGSTLSAAPPGLAFEVVFLWEQSTAVDPPASVDLAVRAQTWRQSSLDDQHLWFDPTVTHEGPISVSEGSGS